jgi:hypothetical protein
MTKSIVLFFSRREKEKNLHDDDAYILSVCNTKETKELFGFYIKW